MQRQGADESVVDILVSSLSMIHGASGYRVCRSRERGAGVPSHVIRLVQTELNPSTLRHRNRGYTRRRITARDRNQQRSWHGLRVDTDLNAVWPLAEIRI